MTEFTPLASAFGGALIGLSAVLLMALNGRIAGISGIGSSVLLLTGAPLQQTVSSNVGLMVIAGLITGFGSVYGGGCTSGHGVCGMSRLSMRSLIATGTFMVTAFVTVLISRHVIGGGI